MFAKFASVLKNCRTLCVIGLATMLGHVVLAQTEAVTPASSQPVGALYTIAVGKIEVAPSVKKAATLAGKQLSLERLTDMMDGQMIVSFQNSQKFKVLARSDLAKLIEEQGVEGTCKLVGATHLLLLNIDDFSDITEFKTVAGICSQATRTVRILPVVKIYDSQGSDTLATASMPVESRISTTIPAGVVRNGNADDRAISVVAQTTADRLANRIIDVLYPPKVVRRNDKEVAINRGDTSGIAIGQLWQVRGPDTIESDPDTKARLHIPGPVLGKVKVDEVQPKSALATVIEETVPGQISKGASLSMPKTENARAVILTVDEQLNVRVNPESALPTGPASSVLPPAPAAKGLLTVGVFSFKVPPAVRAEVVKAGREPSLDYVIAQLNTQFIHRLQETGKYNLVTFADLEEIAKAKGVQLTGDFDASKIAPLFKMIGAKYIFVTTVDAFTDAVEITRTPTRRGHTTIDGSASISVVTQLLNLETGEIVDTVAVKRQVTQATPTVLLDGVGFEGGGGNPLLLDLSNAVAGDMAVGIVSRMYPIKVSDRTGNEITVNIGSPVVLPGQVWAVRAAGKQKLDPDTGKTITIRGQELGRVQITENAKDTAIGQVVEEIAPNAVNEGAVLTQLLGEAAPTAPPSATQPGKPVAPAGR